LNKKRKKSSSKSPKKSFLSRRNIAVFLLVFSLPILTLYSVKYFNLFFQKEVQTKEDKSTLVLMNKMKKMLEEEKNRLNSKEELKTKSFQKLPPALIKKEKKEEENHLSEISDYQKSLEGNSKVVPQKRSQKIYKSSGKPKLAIIIDDVSYARQVRLIKQIPYKVTPSFFPATHNHPRTPMLAKQFSFAMVHLPLEAINYAKPEPYTLRINDSFYVIKKRIETIKKEFPSVQYYNNHTGSKFTSNAQAMDKLFRVFQKEHLFFVDSRTTAKTQAPQIAQKYGVELYARDVFLDNDIHPSAIRKQLLKAVSIAKKHGFAIAIGHPHSNTLDVLKHAKPLLKDVQMVYLKEL
jgi:uncharacterized protein